MTRKKLENLMETFDDFMSNEAEKAQERVAKRFEKIVQMQLDLWSQKYPRHKFYAEESNGSLTFTMEPGFRCSKTSPGLKGMFDYVPGYAVRGAIAKILEESETLQDLYVTNFNVMPSIWSDSTIEGKRA